MKNLIIKISSILVLAIIPTVISAQAQSNRVYQAQIPFDFQVGNNVYPAGNYIIRVEDLHKAPLLTVENMETRQWKRMLAPMNGHKSKAEKTSLIFTLYSNYYVLKQMVAPEFGLTVPKAKNAEMIGKKNKQPEKIVALIMKGKKNE